jgi:hypothetical protein
MQMKPRILIICFLILSFSKSFGQSPAHDSLFYPYRHCAYLEFLGNAETLLSLNYEYIINAKSERKFHYSVRAGFGTYSRRQDTVRVWNFPFELNFIYGKRKHYIESSIGYTASFGKPFIDSEYTPPAHFGWHNRILVFRAGYRFMYDGILVRITPLYIYNPDFLNKTQFRACLSLGIAF